MTDNTPPGFVEAFAEQLAGVFKRHPELPDHRAEYPWLEGWLGDPGAGIWFVGENPALGQVKNQATRGHIDPNAQWNASPGDKLFRRTLARFQFKDPPAEGAGGWHAYITNVVKSAHAIREYRTRSSHTDFASLWAPLLDWELRTSSPRLVVAMGKNAWKALTRLDETGRIRLPRFEGERALVAVPHYSYIGQRADAQRRLGPMNPIRVAEYEQEFAHIAAEWRRMGGKPANGSEPHSA